jgi:methionyl-tRNA formyltransferase
MTLAAKKLRLIFAGTPEFAAHHLQVLIDAAEHNGYTIVGVYTQPDRPAGRGKKLTPSAVKKLALSYQLPIFQPPSLKDNSAQTELKSLNADAMIVVAYGLILPKVILDTPTYGCLNVHGSLLPRWRGAAPIQRAILGDATMPDGDRKTGVTIMQMDAGLDTGDMLLTSICDIDSNETTLSLHDKLIHLGSDALLKVIVQIKAGTLKAIKQNDVHATYAEKISKQEAQINWNLSAKKIERSIRAYNPFPVAYTFFDQQRIKIYSATFIEYFDIKGVAREKSKKIAIGEILKWDENGLIVNCAEGVLQITCLQLPGKKAMSVSELMNGYQDFFSLGTSFE